MRIRYSESEIIKTSVGDHDIYSNEHITNTSGAKIIESCDGETIYGNPDQVPELKFGNYFKKGYWTNHNDQPITRAVYGQKLRFHIEFDLEYATIGDTFEFGLYDDDRNDYYEDTVKNVDDFINLVLPESGKDYNTEKIGEGGKTVIEFTTTDNLENLVEKCDTDKIFELYFRCSYNGKDGIENTELPILSADYLKLGTIVIDRFKMPGINPEGTDIAEDMCYGTGIKYPDLPIYPQEILDKYIRQYEVFGFDPFTHRVFSNEDNTSLYKTSKKIELTEQTNEQDETYKIAIDNTRVNTPRGERLDVDKIQEQNRKAKYDKQQIYDAKFIWSLNIPLIDIVISGEIDTGKDVEDFDQEKFLGLIKRDDNYLFRIFKDRAQALFSRGEMDDNIGNLIEKFRRNEGGIFESEMLTRHALKRIETDEYCQKVEDYIAEQLKNNFSNLEKVVDGEPYFLKINSKKPTFFNSKGERDSKEKKKEFDKPTYSYGAWYEAPIKGTDGLTIALNDIWASEVLLKELHFEGDTYTAKYEIILWDHFGLDLPDLEKKFNVFPLAKETFVCWFILQHLRGYKPFFTKIRFEKQFRGDLKDGGTEREKTRKLEKEQKAKELNQKMRDDMWREPKF